MKHRTTIYTLVTFSSIIVVFLCLTAFNVLPLESDWSSSIQAFAVAGALIVSTAALIYAKREYNHNKKSEKTALLCQYLQRYSDSPLLKKAEEYILESSKVDNNGKIVAFDNNKQANNPLSVREKERFMHFFEELQLLIDNKMLEKETVIKMMGYYIGVFHKIEEFHKDVTDYDDERYWGYYLKFVRSIPDNFFS